MKGAGRRARSSLTRRPVADILAAVARKHRTARAHPALLFALLLAGALTGLSVSPVARAPRFGGLDPTFCRLPGHDRPVPERPEGPDAPIPPAIVRSAEPLPTLSTLDLTSFAQVGGPRDGFPPRLERPPEP